MTTDDLIRLYGDALRHMDHGDYAQLAVKACGPSPAVESAVRLAKADPERRLRNISRDRVLRLIHSQQTGVGAEFDTNGLDLN